jgi:LytS/YehU family sensor histidine kinase
MRFEERLRPHFHIDPGCDQAHLPSLLLQPLVENAIRHGNASRATGGAVEVRVERAGAGLEIDVSDDGPGAVSGADLFGQGVGLSATRDRLRLLYGDAQRFEAGNRGQGFAVHIVIPYRLPSVATSPAESSIAVTAEFTDAVAGGAR